MATVFIDSFDHYADVTQKWDNGGAGFNTNPSFIRTGIQSLNPGGGGFDTLPRKNFPHVNTMTMGVAFIAANFAGNSTVFFFFNQSGGGFQTGTVTLNSDGSLTIAVANVTIGRTAANLIVANSFAYIEFQGTFQVAGSCLMRVNGLVVFTFAGDMTGGVGQEGIDGFFLPGNNQLNFFYDDLYLVNDTPATIGPPNDDFLGAIQVEAYVPSANESPLNWTPLAGTNFSEVNQIPPPGDAAYVFDNTVGDIDQYKHPIVTGPYQIFAVQHSLCCRLDSAGSHTVCSQIGANSGASEGVGSTYDMIVTPWDGNPVTGKQWVQSDFATTFFGPKITA